MNKKKYPYRHVSVTYWINSSRMQVIIYDEDENGKSPKRHKGRCYEKVSNHTMLNMTHLIYRNGIQPNIVMGDDNVDIFFWMKRESKRKS